MSSDRFVVIGLARVRAPWFAEVARWAQAAAVPIDFIKCISPSEVQARLASGRAVSALILDAGAPGIDRDLIDQAREHGVPSIIIDDPRVERDWRSLGAAEVLPDRFERAELVAALAQHATAVQLVAPPNAAGLLELGAEEIAAWQGHTTAVCGPGGAGSSTMAMALAQGLAAMPVNRGAVVLADLSLHADLAMYHDTGDVVPGLQELVEAHHGGRPSVATIRRMLYDIDTRGYLLLLGVRRSRDWTALRPRALEASLRSLSVGFRHVIADIDADFDGEDATGSVDVEERHGAARQAASTADVCVIVADATLRGIHSGVRIAVDLIELGVEPSHVMYVINRAPRSPRARADIVAALTSLSPEQATDTAPVFIGERRGLEAIHRIGGSMPATLVAPLTSAVGAVLARQHGEGPSVRPEVRVRALAPISRSNRRTA